MCKFERGKKKEEREKRERWWAQEWDQIGAKKQLG